MKQATWMRALTVAALLLVAPALTWAQDGDLAVRLAEAGWEQVDNQVFQRHLEDGTIETVGWGLPVVAWELDRVRERIADLEALQLELGEPSIELRNVLSFHHSLALELEAELRGEGETPIPLQPQTGELRSLAGALGCTLVITRDAFAFPTPTGPAASATAAFSDTCPTSGQVRATAHAEGIYNGAFRSNTENDPATGRRNGIGSASASASASVVATSSCYSNASARVWIVASNGDKVPFVSTAFNTQCRIVFPDPDPGECLTSVAPCTELP